MIAEGDVKIRNGFKIAGIAPPDLASYDQSTRKLYWTWVLKLALARKDKELAAGLDKNGKPLRPISAATRKHRRSAMTPSGRGDPAAPPLMPGFQKSRTRSLLNGRALSTHVDLFWRFDAWTGESWSVVLSYQAARGRDVFGISKEGLAWIKVKSWAMWEQWKAGTLRQVAEPKRRAPAMPKIGRVTADHVDFGVSTSGGTGTPASFKAGTLRGFSTPSERRAYFTQTAAASLPGRAANPGSKSPLVGPKYNRLLSHVWGRAGGPARGGSPPAGPRITPPPVPKTPKPVKPPKPVKLPPLPKFGLTKAAIKTPDGQNNALDAAQTILGRRPSLRQLASLTGATSSSKIKVTTRVYNGSRIYFQVSDDKYDAERYIRRDANGVLYMKAEGFFIGTPYRGQGIGAEVFGRMVENAIKLGIERIDVLAFRSSDANGYYTWPRFGYDGDLPEDIRSQLPEALKPAKRLSDLFESPEGQQWWKTNGRSINLTFDLKPGSPNLKAWEKYRRMKTGGQ